ncbi:glycoside hydrolase superfamily [Mortierella sp. GBAus27b]|nr:glycoside hydrolase superfamily [Mortierella sp. GBAus27b]
MASAHPGTFIVCTYFVAWAIYARNHNVFDLPVQDLTHVLYAFANLDAEGNVVLGDAWADTDKHYEDDSWNDTGKNLYGNFKRLGLLKKANRHLKVSLSIGGWTWSTNFPAVAASPEKRAIFVKTSIELLNNLGLDGLDIDWEYPKTDEQAADYVSLLRELREALDQYAAEKGDSNPYIITGAMPCGEDNYSVLRLSEMNRYMDRFYLMAYDLAGSWSKTTGHQSNLHGGDANIHKAIQHYLRQGIPPHKIVMGMPSYGRAFQNTDGINHPYDGVGQGSWEQGVYDYKVLPLEGATEFYDSESVSSYSYDPVKRELITYDTPMVVDRKSEYIAHNRLGGAMFWESSSDHKGDHSRSLTAAVSNSLRTHAPLDTTPNHLNYPTSVYDNVRAGFE